MGKPLIGITASTRELRPNLVYDIAYSAITQAVERAGGLPVLIPSSIDNETLNALYRRVDGLLLPGGGDIDPDYFDEPRHPSLNLDPPTRDATEVALTRWAVRDDMPIFGICRGIQVMNVALGGSLIQDIPSGYVTEIEHDTDTSNGTPRNSIKHKVSIEESSHLASILRQQELPVNSLHHQAVGKVAPIAEVSAVATDGIVEGIEVPGKQFVLGVQWHPEDMLDDERMMSLFKAFVDSASSNMKNGTV